LTLPSHHRAGHQHGCRHGLGDFAASSSDFKMRNPAVAACADGGLMSRIISTGIPATLGVEGQTGVTSVLQVVGGYRFDFQPFDHAFIAVFHDLPIG